MAISYPRRPRKRLPLTPLIDVIFLLLLFFMLSSTFLRYAAVDIATSPPSAAQGASAGPSKTALLKLRHDGTLSLNGTDVAADGLIEALEGLKETGIAQVMLSSETGASVQNLVTLMERLEAGPMPVALSAGRQRQVP
ncbi:biopolymer transporter ExbD [Acuticoccus sp. M5D2P5]|uniref:ExbD/TolR family protein n=1 Tax=Acuticoccus kalidii TaxID=2910977 RepID=UPI001F442591|nr:biopolymer transporter ExbD [Acuticoccus kalidii]MCF3935780.1 biopolymer transporter ExbD [Acuticoccus kalidii]